MITATGIGSGLDVASIVSQLVIAEGQPASVRLDTQEAEVQAQLSAFGSLSSGLSQFSKTLEALSDIDKFRSRTASSADSSFFTASVTSEAVPGTYQVEVKELAQAHKIATGAVADPEAAVGDGVITITIGEGGDGNFFNVIVADDPETEQNESSLEAIRDLINEDGDNPGVVATILQADDGAHLVLTSSKTGEEFELTVATSGDAGLGILDYDPDTGGPGMSEIDVARNATVVVDSFTYTSASNSVSGLIDGVTISLKDAEVGVKNNLTIAYDRNAATSKVREFVDGYNALVAQFDTLSSYDPESEIAGVLLGDSTLRNVETELRNELYQGRSDVTLETGFLFHIGVTTNTDGTLEIDEEVLSDALDADFDAVGALFAEEDGYAVRLDAVLSRYIDDGGLIETRQDGLRTDIDEINEDRDALDQRLAALEARYLAQFSSLDAIVSELTATSEFLAQQLALIPIPGQ